MKRRWSLVAAALLVVPVGYTVVNQSPALASGYFQPAVAYEVDADTHSVAVADVTGDGRPDCGVAPPAAPGSGRHRLSVA